MASPRRNLPAFTEIAERVALLESIRSSPSAVPAHYANILEDIAVVLRKWSGLAPAIAANPEAAASRSVTLAPLPERNVLIAPRESS